jgi:signal transduction protein with GAF and PtsI domain
MLEPQDVLPDEIRVPLHTIRADAGYMFGRVAADGSVAAEFTAHLQRLSGELETAVHAELVSSRAEIERLREALEAAQAAEDHNMNCEECGGEGEMEACPECFPLADDARLKRWAALNINQPVARTALSEGEKT